MLEGRIFRKRNRTVVVCITGTAPGSQKVIITDQTRFTGLCRKVGHRNLRTGVTVRIRIVSTEFKIVYLILPDRVTVRCPETG